MKVLLRKYQKNLLQIAGMLIAFFITRRLFFLYLGIGFFLLLLIAPGLSLQFGEGIDRLLRYIGKIIKRILFGLLFILLLTPLSFLRKCFAKGSRKDPTSGYSSPGGTAGDLSKMW